MIHLTRHRVAKTAVVVNEPVPVRGGRLRGVEIHAASDAVPTLFVQVRAQDGAFWFSTGWPGSRPHSGRWLPDKTRAWNLDGREVAAGFTATGERRRTQLVGPDGVTVEFRRTLWLRVAAYNVTTGKHLANFDVVARRSFVSLSKAISESELSCVVVAMASGVVLLTRPFPSVAVVAWLLPWQRPVMKSRRAQEALAQRLLGRVPLQGEQEWGH